MYIDSQTQLSDNQALTAAGTIASTNSYDTGSTADVGVGYPTKFYATATEAFAGGTSVQAILQTSADNSTWETLASGAAIPLADLTAGKKLAAIDIPHGAKRYLRGAYVVTGTFTAGKVHASLTLDVDGNNRGQIASGIPRF